MSASFFSNFGCILSGPADFVTLSSCRSFLMSSDSNHIPLYHKGFKLICTSLSWWPNGHQVSIRTEQKVGGSNLAGKIYFHFEFFVPFLFLTAQ